MKRIVVTAAAAMILATAAWAESTAEKTGVNSALGIAPSTQDFVTQAAASDMFEIESSKLALERADEPTKAFAQQMVADHTKTSGELKALVASGKVKATLPTAMSEEQQSTLAELKALQGDAFTQQYHDDQVEAHENAVDLFTRFGEEGEQADLKAWASTTLPHLKHHLEAAEKLDK
jgi:putative membrane protein